MCYALFIKCMYKMHLCMFHKILLSCTKLDIKMFSVKLPIAFSVLSHNLCGSEKTSWNFLLKKLQKWIRLYKSTCFIDGYIDRYAYIYASNMYIWYTFKWCFLVSPPGDIKTEDDKVQLILFTFLELINLILIHICLVLLKCFKTYYLINTI